MTTTTNRQLTLPFDTPRETARLERVERIMGGRLRGRVTTAAKLWNESEYCEATAVAEGRQT